MMLNSPSVAAPPPEEASTPFVPWALEIHDPYAKSPLYCFSIPGTSDTIGGMRVNWECFPCKDKNECTSLGKAVGHPNTNNEKPWTVSYIREGSSETTSADVITVWR